MELTKFSEKININDTQEIMFDYTQDYDNRLSWDTFLKKAELIDGATKADKGVRAYCVAKNGLGMESEYVSFNRPKVTAVKMTQGLKAYKQYFCQQIKLGWVRSTNDMHLLSRADVSMAISFFNSFIFFAPATGASFSSASLPIKKVANVAVT